jgi:hypothetical protein
MAERVAGPAKMLRILSLFLRLAAARLAAAVWTSEEELRNMRAMSSDWAVLC